MHISNILYYEEVPFCFGPWKMSDESTHRNNFQTGLEKVYANSFEHTTVDLVNSEMKGEKPVLK